MDEDRHQENKSGWKKSYVAVDENFDAYIEVLFTKIFKAQEKEDGQLLVDEEEILKFIQCDLTAEDSIAMRTELGAVNPSYKKEQIEEVKVHKENLEDEEKEVFKEADESTV